MPRKPRKGSKAERSAEKKMTPEEKLRKHIKDAGDYKKVMESKNQRLIKDVAHFKRELGKYDYMDEASEVVTHKFTFDFDLSDFKTGAYESDEKTFLDGSIGTVFLAYKSERKTMNGMHIAASNSCDELWRSEKNSHRLTFRLNKPLTEEKTMKIEFSMWSTGSFLHNMRTVMKVNHEMLPEQDFDERNDEGYNDTWEIHFTPKADEIEENFNGAMFNFQVKATQVKME